MSSSTLAPQISDYRSLFLEQVALLDLRAPVEFSRGAFPHAHNLPLMTDAERAAVGTAYKQQGQAAAVRLGHELVGGAIREQRIQAWLQFANSHPNAVLYCFRGGMRSQIVQQWLAEAGVVMPRVVGGYKALRSYLLTQLDSLADTLSWCVLAGRTGSGKTDLLTAQSRHLDLEGHARHRGSAFGRLPQEQPTPINFDNALAISLLQLQAQSHAPVLIEDESHLVGRLRVPPALFARMQQAPIVELRLPLEQRVEQVLQDYVVGLRHQYVQALGTVGVQAHADYLKAAMSRIRRRLGGLRYTQLAGRLEQALREGQDDAHRDWIAPLLQEYYDPMYDHHMRTRRHRVLFQGDAQQVQGWLSTQDWA